MRGLTPGFLDLNRAILQQTRRDRTWSPKWGWFTLCVCWRTAVHAVVKRIGLKACYIYDSRIRIPLLVPFPPQANGQRVFTIGVEDSLRKIESVLGPIFSQ